MDPTLEEWFANTQMGQSFGMPQPTDPQNEIDSYLSEVYGSPPAATPPPGVEPIGTAASGPAPDVGTVVQPIGAATAPSLAPAPTPLSTATQPVAVKTGRTTSSSASDSGFSSNKAKEVEAFVQDPVGEAAVVQGINAEAEQRKAEAAKVRRQQTSIIANQLAADLEDDRIRKELNTDYEKMLKSQDDAERTATVNAQIREQQALVQHEAALREWNAMSVNPGELWAKQTSGEKFGSIAAIFVTGMLGARGINTGLMPLLEKAIDRNIDAQVANIGKKGEAVGKFKQLWDMTRQNSASEAEAREKMRGFQMAEFKAHTISALGALGTPLAKLKAEMAAAEFDKQYIQHLDKVREYRRAAENERLGMDRNYRVQMGQLSLQRKAESRMQAAQDFEMASRMQPVEGLTKEEQEVLQNSIPDPTPGGEAKFWKSKTDDDDKVLKTKMPKYSTMLAKIERYRQAANKMGEVWGNTTIDKLSGSKEYAAYKAARTELMTMLTTGYAATTFTDAFVKRMEGLLPEDTLLTANAVNSTAGRLMDESRQEMNSELSVRATLVDKKHLPMLQKYAYRPEYDFGNQGTTVRGNELSNVTGTAARDMKQETPQVEPGKLLQEVEAPDNETVTLLQDPEAIQLWKGAGFKAEAPKGLAKDFKGVEVPKWVVTFNDLRNSVKNMSVPTEERLKVLNYLQKKREAYLADVQDGGLMQHLPGFNTEFQQGQFADTLMQDLETGGWLEADRFSGVGNGSR